MDGRQANLTNVAYENIALASFSIAVYGFSTLASLIIMLVFWKDGLKTTSNVSFFALAVADLLVSVSGIGSEITSNSLLINSLSDVHGTMNKYVFRWGITFDLVGSWITVIITWERLCCIAFPLKVRRIFTVKLNVCLIVGGSVYQVIATAISLIGQDFVFRGARELVIVPYFDNIGRIRIRLTNNGRWELGKKLVMFSYVSDTVIKYVLYAAIVIGTVLLVFAFWRSIQMKKSLSESKDLESDIEAAAEFRDGKTQILTLAKERLKGFTKAKESSSQNVDDASDATEHSSRPNTKLPKLELPKFSGDYTEWQTFIDKFRAVVDEADLPAVNKFTYLQSLLQGEAASAIAGLSLTAENYAVAKDILRKRFGRTERIIFSHVQKLLETNWSSNSTVGSTPLNLWRLHDDLQARVRSLHNLGISGETYGVILTPLILHQLPQNIRLEWARRGEGHEGDLEFLLTFLFEEIQRRERSQTFNNSRSGGIATTREKPGVGPTEKRRQYGTAAALVATTKDHQSSSRTHCVFCSGSHYSDKCAELKNLDFSARKDKLRQLGLCFRCLGSHLAKDCSKTCYLCKGNHHSVLCLRNLNKNKPVKHDIDNDREKTAVKSVFYSETQNMTTIMQVVKTNLKGKEINVMFDSGSDRSFITQACAKDLKLDCVDKEHVSFACFGDKNPQKEDALRSVFELEVDENKIHLLGIEIICSSMRRSKVPLDVLKHFEFEGISFGEDYQRSRQIKIDILIGLDWYWPLIKNQVLSSHKGLVAHETLFGWMLSGVVWNKVCENERKNYDHECTTKSQALFCQTVISDNVVRKLWELDSIGIECDGTKEESSDNFVADFCKGIEFDEERYTVRLPWKSPQSKALLLDNKEQASKRLDNLSKKFDKNPELKEKYDTVLQDFEREGFIEEVSQDEINSDSESPTFYLPHRPVIREESLTTKIRPVFDASCKGANGVSLNDCMNSGPNLIPDLVQILLRFRQWKYALTADITKAFLQINLHPEDRDVHRFLWNLNGNTRVMRFKRVTFGNTCSPFLLNATLRFHLSKFEHSATVEKLQNNLYVDDWLTGADTETEIMDMMSEADEIMQKGGFPLSKWASNCQLAKDEFSKVFNGFTDIECLKVLGVSWMTKNDCFTFQTLQVLDHPPFTKRLLLSVTARLFDPLGFLTPFSITLKILFQQAWRQGFDWDDVLPEEFQKELKLWMAGLLNIQEWQIPRRISAQAWSAADQKELVAYADASEKAYGACIYLKTTKDNNSEVILLMSRVKVAPLKKITLPRLELLAALLGARLLKFTKTALNLDGNIHYSCWTDSQIVLSWIKSDPIKWKQFVSNRVSEIQELTSPECWQHCPGKDNPADLLTRGIPAKELTSSTLWIHGPDWLKQPRKTQKQDVITSEVCELAEEAIENPILIATMQITHKENVLDYKRFSSLTKLTRTIAWVLRFVKNTRRHGKRLSGDLSTDELEEGKLRLLLWMQNDFYSEEISDLQRGSPVKRSSSIAKLSPFLADNGLLRIKGRLDMAPLLYDEKHPILLPKCHASLLLVKAQHDMMKHAGVNTLISTLRSKYWIVSVRALAKKVCRSCIHCQRQDKRPLDQTPSQLPEDRVKRSPPFSVVGVDHAGPLVCSDTGDKKMYILLFTCAVIRAVHIELVNSLSLEDFLMAFKRFSARRGQPSIIYSDNAQTFKGASKIIQREMGLSKLVWKFSVPLAPWFGGFWERLIRSIKSSLRKTLGNKLVTRTLLETLLHEIEACINSRPLTYIEESGMALTPSHFLIGRNSPLLPVEVVDHCQDGDSLVSRHGLQREIIESFWQIWLEKYIRNLPPLMQKKQNSNIKVGSVVLLREEGKPRLRWPLGIVTKMFEGKDGLVRAVELKTNKGIITRAIQKLHKLEMLDEEEQKVTTLNPEGEGFDKKVLTEVNFESDLEDKTPKESRRDDNNMFPSPESSKGIKPMMSRKGRVLKPTKIFDL
ncbi:Gypsy retrotransposon integrase-like protein 1 [Elysia marginata]|uniref:Gypsy retrotransposon integrase-like protein 1 n=1 Tax=Elysia marginata TaxID=1093978 RepID=A0AAV4FEL9_9GAST|nr:Gypsy retrotransposon integrase-like protein 1 [Elysia marginata]